MRSRGVVRLGVALLVMPLLLGVATANASAKTKHKKPKSPPVTSVSATRMTSADNQQVTTTATCPSGLIAVGGGFQTPAVLDAGAPTDLNLVYESRRAGDGAWQASAVREDTGSPGPDLPVTAIVDCRSTKLASKKPSGKKAAAAKKKKKLRIIEATGSAVAAPADAAQASASAACPAKTTALGGGFSSSPTPVAVEPEAFPYIWSNHRTSPTAWTAALSNVGTVSRTITSYAYCAAGLKIAETTAAVPLPGSGPTVNSATATTPPCPKGKALLGGGFNNTPASESSAIALPTGSSPANGSWQLGTLNFNPAPGTISSTGYCA